MNECTAFGYIAERALTSKMTSDMISLGTHNLTALPVASEAKVVGRFSSNVVLTEMFIQVLSTGCYAVMREKEDQDATISMSAMLEYVYITFAALETYWVQLSHLQCLPCSSSGSALMAAIF